jgi:hypothetical protein
MTEKESPIRFTIFKEKPLTFTNFILHDDNSVSPDPFPPLVAAQTSFILDGDMMLNWYNPKILEKFEKEISESITETISIEENVLNPKSYKIPPETTFKDFWEVLQRKPSANNVWWGRCNLECLHLAALRIKRSTQKYTHCIFFGHKHQLWVGPGPSSPKVAIKKFLQTYSLQNYSPVNIYFQSASSRSPSDPTLLQTGASLSQFLVRTPNSHAYISASD